MNFLVRAVRCFSIWLGMPWAAVWNWVIPLIIIWAICLFLLLPSLIEKGVIPVDRSWREGMYTPKLLIYTPE